MTTGSRLHKAHERVKTTTAPARRPPPPGKGGARAGYDDGGATGGFISPPEATNTGPGFNRGSGGGAWGCGFEDFRLVELELELIQSHMAQKPVLRGEVGCACVAREVSVERGGMGERGCARRLVGWGWASYSTNTNRP